MKHILNNNRLMTGLLSRVSIIAFLAAVSVPAFAQEAESSADDNSNVIIVTANKRSLNLQEIPAAVSALSGDQLEQRGITDIESLAMQIPNVNFGSHDGASFVTIRGVGASVEIGIGEPSVATYVDGIFLPRQTMGFLSQVDLERVEVVRGPQGTLYGRNATGGAINFIARKPTDEPEFGANFNTGSFNKVDVSGYASGPIGDSVSVRLSGGSHTQDGYVDNLLDGSRIGSIDKQYVRGAIRIKPDFDGTIDLVAQYEHSDGTSAYQQALTTAASPLIPAGTLTTTVPNQIFAEHGFAALQETFIASATVDVNLSDSVNLKTISGYIDHKSSATFDGDATNYALVDVEEFIRPSKSVSQEINLSGETGRLQWIVGAYYFHEKFTAQIPAPLPNGVPGQLPPGSTSLQRLDETTESIALFSELTFSITDSLRITGGLRANWEDKDFRQQIGAIIPMVGFFGASNIPSSASDNSLLPKVSLQYDINPDAQIYAQFQQGQKSGGQNLAVLNSQYRPEQIDAYEIGIRSRAFDNRITFNAAVFRYDYTDYQVTDLPGGTTTDVVNADARITGGEIEISGELFDNFNLNMGATYLDSEFTRFSSLDLAAPALGRQDLRGRKLPRAPKFTTSAGAQYDIPIASDFVSGITLRGDVFYSDDVVLRYFGTTNDRQESYATVNVSAAVRLLDDQLTLRAYVNNLTDEIVKRVVIFSPLSGSYLGNYSQPRVWGLGASVKF